MKLLKRLNTRGESCTTLRRQLILVAAFLCLVSANQAAVAAQSPAARGFEECLIHFANATPPTFRAGTLNTRPLCFESFAVLHSATTRTPVYVAERLNRATLSNKNGGRRTNRFFEDARLPFAERATLNDYDGSGFARGHMAPAGDMLTASAMAQSFSLANIVPQASRNNSGVWAGIERATRKYVMRADGDIYILTGPVFEPPARYVGTGKVQIPRYLFKLVYDPSTNRAWAHWIENIDEARASRPISYTELVKRTGIRFLPNVRPDD